MTVNKILHHWISPTVITLFVCVSLVVVTLIKADGDIFQFIVIGTRFSELNPQGSEGYDGQFGYYIAIDPNPHRVEPHLDVAAYRYQRILLPILARFLAFGDHERIAWWLALLPLVGQVVGVGYVAKILSEMGQQPMWALIYGLSAGCLLSIRVALPEPIAYACVAAGIYYYLQGNNWKCASFMLLAFLAKEVTLVFGLAILLAFWQKRNWRGSQYVLGISFLPFALWQLWLWSTFGSMGIGSGGGGASGFEFIPFMGLIRIANYSMAYFLGMLVVFAPLVVVPSIWGTWVGLQKIYKGQADLFTVAIILHSLTMFFLPFSTYRETGGILRLSVGFCLAFLLYLAKENHRRLLGYLPFWFVYNVFLVR